MTEETAGFLYHSDKAKVSRKKQKTTNLISFYPIYVVLLLLFITAFIFIAFFLRIYINHWTIVTAFITYSLCWFVYLFIKRTKKTTYGALIVATIITPLLFWGLTATFSHTYDVSYDGQQYQQMAVIALANKWNPVHEAQLPIQAVGQFPKSLDQGSPKVVWSIDASIYKLTGNINSATAINAVIMLLAFCFFFMALKDLKLGNKTAIFLAVLAVITELSVDQIFSFRQDAVSYEFLIIGIASVIMAFKKSNKLPYFLCVVATIIFLAGTKFTNSFILISFLLGLAYIVIKFKWYKLKSLLVSTAALIIIGFITLFNPYITNLTQYHAIDYPYNNKSIALFAKNTDESINIRRDNRFELLFYGIFSKPDTSNPQTVKAQLKSPLSLSNSELQTEADPAAKVVGGYGPLFGLIMIASIICFLYAVCFEKKGDKKILKWVSAVLGLIILACLLNPVPNYARFNGELALFPIAVIILLAIRQLRKKRKIEKILYIGFKVILCLNLYITLAYSIGFNYAVFNNLNFQLASLRNSHTTYAVYSNDFYSNYTMLRQAGVSIEVSSKPVYCPNSVIVLIYSRNSTELCRTDFNST